MKCLQCKRISPLFQSPLHEVRVPSDPTEVGWREHAELPGRKEEAKLLAADRLLAQRLTATKAAGCHPLEGCVISIGEDGNLGCKEADR